MLEPVDRGGITSAGLVSFIAFAAFLTIIPGPAIVLITENAVLHGRSGSVLTALGVFCGDLVWAGASVAGLTALLVASRPAFEALRFLGAAYLIYLGLRLILHRHHDNHDAAADAPATRMAPRGSRAAHGRAYAEGLLCELSNPKTLIVFTSVIPPFLPTGAGPGQIAVLGVTFALAGLTASLAYALVFSATRRLVRRPRTTNAMLRGSGGILTAFGIGLLVEGVRTT